MIIEETSGHPRLNYEALKKLYSGSEVDGELVTSPFDLFSVETVRDLTETRKGQAYPCDAFVWALGESPRPYLTKFGGVPFWPAKKLWPSDGSDRPLRFLAQLCFVDSLDIVLGLPGDVLSVLGDVDHTSYIDEENLSFAWHDSTERVTSRGDLPAGTEYSEHVFHGVIHRTADYPESYDEAFKYEDSVSHPWLVSDLHATKIGGCPNWVQVEHDGPGSYFAQLASIQAASEVPYPWANEPEPLDCYMTGGKPSIYDRSVVFQDMASFYFLEEAGVVGATCQSH